MKDQDVQKIADSSIDDRRKKLSRLLGEGTSIIPNNFGVQLRVDVNEDKD